MTDSYPTAAIGRMYDRFQDSFESLGEEWQYLNYGYAEERSESLVKRQERLCRKVFEAAAIGPGDVVIDVGFGSGEQDFLLLRTHEIAELHGFNISQAQVEYARRRAARTPGGERLRFHHGAAEGLEGMAPGSADAVLAIECAFYFDRPRFYARAAEVLKPGGRLALADLYFTNDTVARMVRNPRDRRRMGTRAGNRAEWEKHFRTLSVTDIGRRVRPGAQASVYKILRRAPFSGLRSAETRTWIKLAWLSQQVAWGLWTGVLSYDLIALEKP